MKNLKKVIVITIIVIILLVGGIFGIYKLFKDENSLSITEKTWINKNINSVFTIYVPNDINIFGKSGNGVYFDFISKLEEDLGLKLNSSVYSITSNNDSFGFNVGTSYDSRDLLLFTDYYVLINKEGNSICNLSEISDKKIGVISKDLAYITNYYTLTGTITSYDSSDAMFEALKNSEVDYVIAPRTQYKDVIISNSYNIAYFFNDAKVYYYLHLGSDETLNSIVTKYYNTWMIDSFDKSYNRNNYSLFIKSLNISDIAEDSLTDKNYKFEYVVSQPYQLLSKGNLTGIVSEYLNSFNEFSDVDFEYVKVKSFKELKHDVDKKKFDLYFDQYNYDSKYSKININLPINYYLISNRDVNLNIDSLKSYKGEIYVLENSKLYTYLENYTDITIKSYSKDSKIKKLIKNDKVVIVDKKVYDNYLIDNLSDINIILEDSVHGTSYTINYQNGEDIFYKLFKSYVNSLNPKEVVDDSLDSYFKTYEAGSRTVKLARTVIIAIVVFLISVYLFIKAKGRIVLNTKVKNNEKIRYVDMLTCLKNRNYLNDRIEIWNQNTVYPQCVVVLDLNNVKYLNDTFGHEEGDKQIKAVANVLFKTQLENTELLRTDGNEFMIYMVGYTEKKVVSYIKKLLKEFKKLPYEYGVAIGFSMINDDLKLIEDAFNEAMLMMRKNKSTFEENDDK